MNLQIFRPDVLMGIIYLGILVYLLFFGRKKELYYLLIASVIAFIWVFVARSQYGYNQDMYVAFGLNFFPLFAWPVGLFASYLVYSRLNYKRKFLIFVVAYCSVLILMETVFYHVFDVKNLATAAYAGLPVCDCMHAPVWMQIVYFAMGPTYLLVAQRIKV